MGGATKPIRLSSHAKVQLFYRGTAEDEVCKAIRESPWQPSELGRLECRNDLAFNQIWNGRHYKIKQVRPIFVEEKKNESVVVTVYVYYY